MHWVPVCELCTVCSPLDAIWTHLRFDHVPALTESGGEDLPHLLSASKIFLSEMFEFLVVPVVDVATLNQAFMPFPASICSLVGEVSAGNRLPVQA